MIKKRTGTASSGGGSPSGSLRSIPESSISSLGGARSLDSAGKGTAGGPASAGATAGTGGELDVQRISDEARGQLVDILGTVEGKKDLVIQPKLISLLEHITPFKFLKRYAQNRAWLCSRSHTPVVEVFVEHLLDTTGLGWVYV